MKKEVMEHMIDCLIPSAYVIIESGWCYGVPYHFTTTYEEALAFLKMTEEEYKKQNERVFINPENEHRYTIEKIDPKEYLKKYLDEYKEQIVNECGKEIGARADKAIEYHASVMADKMYNNLIQRIADVIEECGPTKYAWWKGTKKG